MRFSGDELIWRFAQERDCKLYFDWANETLVRKNAHQQTPIAWESHEKWFTERVSSESLMLVFFHDSIPVGQVRVDRDGQKGIIDYSVDSNYRGRHVGVAMLNILKKILVKSASELYLSGTVKVENAASSRVFENLGFRLHSTIDIHGVPCHEYEFHF